MRKGSVAETIAQLEKEVAFWANRPDPEEEGKRVAIALAGWKEIYRGKEKR